MGQVRRFDPAERLDRAVDAFWENGFEGSAMQALCKAMGIFPGSLYGTYGDKQRLFVQAVDRYMSTVSAEAVEILGRDASGLGALRAYFRKLIDGIVDGKRQWGCLITNTIVELAQRDPEIKAKVDIHLARLETAFAGAIARAREAGEIPPETSLDNAAFLVCVVQGLNVLAKTRPPRQRLELMVSTAVAALGADGVAR
jgi:TetR/AcrR family transcriptional repressor of nem operon